MAVIGALALDAPASGCPKALCGTPVGFQFGHFMLLLFYLRAAVSEPSETLGGCIPANIFRPACARRSCLHPLQEADRKSTRLNSSHVAISYAVFCLKKKK